MAAKISIQNVDCTIFGEFPFKDLDYELSFLRPGFFVSKLYRLCPKKFCQSKIVQKTGKCSKCGTPRLWDGRVRLLTKRGKDYIFPTGCLSIVADTLARTSYVAEIEDLRAIPLSPAVCPAKSIVLRNPDNPTEERALWEHQQEAVTAAVSYQRGVIMAPTGSGKTVVMAALAKLFNLKAVILINKVGIATQLRKEISAMLNEPVGYIGSGKFEPERVTVCMVQSLFNHLGDTKKKIEPLPEALELVQNTQLLMMDETHLASSDTWYKLSRRFQNAYYRYGVSATPFLNGEGNALYMVASTGNLIYEVSEAELIAAGKLAQPIIHIYKIDEPADIPSKANYQEAYELGVVENNYLNSLAARIAMNMAKIDKQVLVLCERIQHIENITKKLKNVDFEILTGETNVSERERVIDMFEACNLPIIVASNVLDMGVDIQNIDVVIRTGLLASWVKNRQQVGRGMRTDSGKKLKVHVVDFFHNTNRYLTEHSEAHYNQYKSRNYPIHLETKPLTAID